MSEKRNIARLVLKVIKLGLIDFYWYIRYVISMINLKMPWNDRKLVFLNVDENSTHDNIILIVHKEDGYDDILECYNDIVKNEKFVPFDENYEEILHKFAANKIGTVLKGSFAN